MTDIQEAYKDTMSNGFSIISINADNIDDYADLMPDYIAENLIRIYHTGYALKRDNADRIEAMIATTVTGAGWDGDKKELIIEWTYSLDRESFKLLIEMVNEKLKKTDISAMVAVFPLSEEKAREDLVYAGFENTIKESILIEIPRKVLAKQKAFNRKPDDRVTSIKELTVRQFRRGLTDLIFHGARGLLNDAEYLPMSWFDNDLSCCIMCGKKIKGMLLVKKIRSSNVVPLLFSALPPDQNKNLLKLMSFFAYKIITEYPDDTGVMICRYNDSIKALSNKLFPGIKGNQVNTFSRNVHGQLPVNMVPSVNHPDF